MEREEEHKKGVGRNREGYQEGGRTERSKGGGRGRGRQEREGEEHRGVTRGNKELK